MPTRKNKKNRKRTIKMRGGTARPDSEMNKLFDYALKILNMVDGKIKDVKTITQLERLFENSSVQQLLYDSTNRDSIVSTNRDSIVSTNSIVSANVDNNETLTDDDDDDDDDEANFVELLEHIRMCNRNSEYDSTTEYIEKAEKLILKIDEIMNVPEKKEKWEYDKKYIEYSKTLNEISILITGNKNIDKNEAKQNIERYFNSLGESDKKSEETNMNGFLAVVTNYQNN